MFLKLCVGFVVQSCFCSHLRGLTCSTGIVHISNFCDGVLLRCYEVGRDWCGAGFRWCGFGVDFGGVEEV